MNSVFGLEVVRGSQLASKGIDIPGYAKRWGFVEIAVLETKLGALWSDIERRYGALYHKMPVNEDLQPVVPTFGQPGSHIHEKFVSAGWVRELMQFYTLGLHQLVIQEWDDLSLGVKLIPLNCWATSDRRQAERRILVALGYDKNGQSKEDPGHSWVLTKNGAANGGRGRLPHETGHLIVKGHYDMGDLMDDYGVAAVMIDREKSKRLEDCVWVFCHNGQIVDFDDYKWRPFFLAVIRYLHSQRFS